MPWKVLITARTMNEVGAPALQLLRDAGCELVIPPKPGPCAADELLKLLPGIDAPAATRAGIVIAYTPGLLDETVADFAFALMLALARRVHVGHLDMSNAIWRGVWGNDVFGKTLGILGCGRIGRAVARRATGFNMRLIAHDVQPNPEAEKLGVRFVSLEELLAQSDFLSLHAALTPQNRGLIGETHLRKMKRTAYLINTARGALVDENALAQALREGWIAGAALDTFAVEPLPAEHILR